jgi:hypothetical protein
MDIKITFFIILSPLPVVFFLGGTFAKVPPKPSSKTFEAGVRINEFSKCSAPLQTDRRICFSL